MRVYQKGLTLLEMLVVLVLVGLITTILVQSVTFVLGSYHKVNSYQQRFQYRAMGLGWYRSSLSNSIATLDSEFAFKGRASSISLYTTAPVFEESGVMVKAEWHVKERDGIAELYYRENEGPLFRVYQVEALRALFMYRGQQGGWQESWPAEGLPEGTLPNRIKLSFHESDTGESVDILSSVKIRRVARSDFRDQL